MKASVFAYPIECDFQLNVIPKRFSPTYLQPIDKVISEAIISD